MAVRIRYAKIGDADAVLDLWWQLHNFHTERFSRCKPLAHVPDARDKIKRYYVETVLPSHRLLVAEDKGRFVGFCEFSSLDLPPIYKQNKMFRIVGLYVLPPYQKKGIGRRLMMEADKVRRLAQLKAVEVEAHVENGDAIEFYSSLGFKKHLVKMVRHYR